MIARTLSRSRQIRGNDAARFASKTTRRDSGCIEWIGTRNGNGYGKFMVGPARNQTTWIAHRWIYQHTHGALPSLLRHRCDNASCVNVDHLEPGTQLDNVHDAMDRGRRPVALTIELVRRLRSVRAAGGSLRAEAIKIGVVYITAYQAACGITWRHVR